MKRTASLTLSKKLKKLGYPQENSEWYWVNFKNCKVSQLRYRDGMYEFEHNNWDYISAPTVEELIDELPPYISCYKFINNEIFGDGKFGFGYGCETHDASNFQYFYVEGITMADACAEAWIYCKENGSL